MNNRSLALIKNEYQRALAQNMRHRGGTACKPVGCLSNWLHYDVIRSV